MMTMQQTVQVPPPTILGNAVTRLTIAALVCLTIQLLPLKSGDQAMHGQRNGAAHILLDTVRLCAGRPGRSTLTARTQCQTTVSNTAPDQRRPLRQLLLRGGVVILAGG